MVKKITRLLLVVVISMAIVYGFLFLKKGKINDAGYFNTIPQDAGLVLKINNTNELLRQLKKENEVLDIIIHNSFVLPFSDMLAKVNADTELRKSLVDNENGMVISFHTIGKNHTVPLIHFVGHTVLQSNFVEHVMTRVYGDVQRVERKYEGEYITDLQLSSNKSLSYVILKNKLLICNSSLVLEGAIRQFKSKNALATNTGFNDIYQISGKHVDANVYINLQLAPQLFSGILKNEMAYRWSSAKKVGNWATLDFNLQNMSLVLTGFVNNKDNDRNLSIFMEQEPVEIVAPSHLPANVVAFQYYGISGFGKFGSHGRLCGLFNDENIKFQGALADNFNSEIVQATLSSLDNENKENNLFMIAIKSKDLAEKWLKGMGAKIGEEIVLDQNTKITLFKNDGDVIQATFGNLFESDESNYACVIDNYIVLSKSRALLKSYAHHIMLGKTLNTNHSYNTLNDHISDKANYFYYSNFELSSSYIQSVYKKDIIDSLKRHSGSSPILGMQLTTSDSLLFSNVILANATYNIDYKPQTVWETLLDTVARFKPVLIENHYSHEKEIFIQDLRNNVYLINKVGRVLWKQKLNEKITSDVFQVDYYKNGKLQILFSTKNKIHLFDRNGNYVEKYPVRLRASSEYGISLFDYDKNRNYRLFVGCDDKKIYAYDIVGNILEGWTFKGAENLLASKVYHFVNKGKDHIVFADRYKMYMLNRRGELRVAIDKVFNFGNTLTVKQLTINGNDGICFNQKNGTITHISYTGKITELMENNLDAYHGFNFMDINGNRKTDFITSADGEIIVSEYNNLKWKKSFSGAKVSNPDFYKFSVSDVKVGFVNYTEGNIYLFNNNGKLYSGFPLTGNSRFTIGRFDPASTSFNLIVCNSNSFLLNYSVK
ncbi:DUF3352 domain-containing protein [Bacteroidales bacterium]|nr:DUF3352 domain-containing protein [Bacteroidales bacterium]